jgi:hypothetical protein
MMDTQDKQMDQGRHAQPESEELRMATRLFMRSLAHTGKSLSLLPVTSIPREPRQHFLAAGREFTRGWAALVRELADGIDAMATGKRASTRSSEDGHSSGPGHVLGRAADHN